MAIFSLAISLLAGLAAVAWIMVVSIGGADSLKLSFLGLGALATTMAIIAVILIVISLATA